MLEANARMKIGRREWGAFCVAPQNKNAQRLLGAMSLVTRKKSGLGERI